MMYNSGRRFCFGVPRVGKEDIYHSFSRWILDWGERYNVSCTAFGPGSRLHKTHVK